MLGADVAIVNEWNEPGVIRLLGRLCLELGVTALFHDTHYRVVLDEGYRGQLGLEQFAHILAFSPSVAERYRGLGFDNVSVLHEAADTTVFTPLDVPKSTDVVFVGNYGDGDRSAELEDYVFGPRHRLPDLRYAIYGVRYPEHVVARLNNGLDISYRGWLANTDVPAVYSAARTVLARAASPVRRAVAGHANHQSIRGPGQPCLSHLATLAGHRRTVRAGDRTSP